MPYAQELEKTYPTTKANTRAHMFDNFEAPLFSLEPWQKD